MSQKQVNIENAFGNINIGDTPEYQVNSAINELLNILSVKPKEPQNLKRRPTAETVVKINYNNLKTKKHIIKQYLDYSKQIEEAYCDIDSLITFGKNTILSNLNQYYYAALDSLGIEYLTEEVDIRKIRESADVIIEIIISNLKNLAFESKNTPSIKETVETGVNVVVAHAFIECIIMETP